MLLARAPEGWGRRSPFVQFSTGEHDAWAVEVPLGTARGGPGVPGPMLALTPDGALVAVEAREVPGGRAVRVHLLHALGCPATRGAVARPWGQAAACRGCGREIYWIETPSGKRAPLDPEPHRGRVLSRAEAVAHRGQKGYAVGLDVNGEQHHILEGGDLPLLAPAAAEATVWVNHFATCPRRGDFAQPRRGSPLGE